MNTEVRFTQEELEDPEFFNKHPEYKPEIETKGGVADFKKELTQNGLVKTITKYREDIVTLHSRLSS